jgi:hypothetical protein
MRDLVRARLDAVRLSPGGRAAIIPDGGTNPEKFVIVAPGVRRV